MNEHLDSNQLFLKQTASHSAVLSELLGCGTGAAPPADTMKKCILGTRMLGGTSSLMELSEWENVFKAYEELLVRYKELGHPWDDRIAQVTSELIVKEETLVETCKSNPSAGIAGCDGGDGLIALREEIIAYIDSIGAAGGVGPVIDAQTARTHGATDVGAASWETAGSGQLPPKRRGEPERSPSRSIPAVDVVRFTPMNGVVTELKNTYADLIEGLGSEAFATGAWESDEVARIHDRLYLMEFYLRSVEQTIQRHSPSATRQKSTLAPLKTALTDFANDVSGADTHALDIVLADNGVEVDPRLLAVAGEIIHRMTADVFSRSDRSALGISIDVEEKNGVLHWRFSDDGNNFMSDSEVDHEDHLAFYPGLKEIGKILNRYNGVLWVEPRNERKTRFEFTLPATTAADAFVVWGEGGGTFAVRSVQLCDLVPSASAQTGSDMFGECLTINGIRVPLVRLNTMFDDGPAGGETIAVLGSLGKRIAFYVPGEGTPSEGKVLENGIPVWRGSAHRVAQLGDRRIALLDADQMLGAYLDRTGEMAERTAAEPVGDAEATESEHRATRVMEAVTDDSPDLELSAVENDTADVLVVEQSESLRNVFADIFRLSGISAVYAASVDDAVGLIRRHQPRVIISEFRMPTMAAKALVELLAEEDRPIPVLVTTSQSGKTAELLVEKLKVHGFLSKPLDRGEVSARISSYIEEQIRT